MITNERYRVWLTPEEMDVFSPYLPTSRGKQRVDEGSSCVGREDI